MRQLGVKSENPAKETFMSASGNVDTLLCREPVFSAPSQLRQLDGERSLRDLSATT